MRKFIDGKIFDTMQAVRIGHAEANVQRESNYWSATLYKTQYENTYFLAGIGGPLTIFSSEDEMEYPVGEYKIIPLLYCDAIDWATEYLSDEEVEFGFAPGS